MKTNQLLVSPGHKLNGYQLGQAKSIRVALCYLLLALSGYPVYGQFKTYIISDLVPIDSQTGDVVYLGMGRVKGMSTADLYTRAKAYFSTTVRPGSLVNVSHHSKRMVRMRGILTLNVVTSDSSQPQDYRVTMEVKVTEGRYRYQFSQFSAFPDSTPGNIPIRELYPSKKRTFDIDEQPARALQSWDKSVRAYIAGFRQSMAAIPVDR